MSMIATFVQIDAVDMTKLQSDSSLVQTLFAENNRCGAVFLARM